jgi:hypothetical protein
MTIRRQTLDARPKVSNVSRHVNPLRPEKVEKNCRAVTGVDSHQQRKSGEAFSFLRW